MKLVLASKNEKKLKEMQDILSQMGVEVCLESAVGVDVDVEETGTTFEENSLLKAKAVMEASGLPAIADDSGLCVDALGGAPGVYSARYGGPGLDDTGRYTPAAGKHEGAQPRDGKIRVASSPAASPTGMCSPPGGSAPAPSPSPPWGRAASAMTRCFSCRD